MITINGQVFNGNSVTINNNQIIVDGVVQSNDLKDAKEIKVDANGFQGTLNIEGNATLFGNVEGNIRAKGSVSCDTVIGDVSAGGSVNCDDIKGNASAGGVINCDDIGGNASAGGMIRRG
ncbi:hypothetical protein [Viridibacillus arvi]|uniref:hypothetical protein n=1 Tax=Viridibacillus arvi TaxID=263475 RepID=UPI0034CF29A9